MKWTRDQDTKLLHCRAAGETAAQIAQMLEKSRNSVLGRIHRLRGGAASTRPHVPKNPKSASAPPLSPESDVLEFERLPDGTPWPAPHGCRFIAGEVSKGTYRWCNRPVESELSWCPACAKVVFERRRKDP